MNRAFFNEILVGFSAASDVAASGASADEHPVKRGSAEDAAFTMKNAGSVTLVPG